jgi:2,4-diketo-3-deoxy-L-fuconate hydrolase
MKLCRFDQGRLGLVQGAHLLDVTAALDVLPSARYPFPRHDLMVEHLDEVMQRVHALRPQAQKLALDRVQLLSPIANPGKVVAAPVNYRKHLDEARAQAEIHHQNQIQDIQRAGLFLKATSAVVGPGEGVTIAHPQRRNDHEAELVVVIGRRAHRVSKAQAFAHVAGYCAGLDMTTRGPEERSLRKSIDSYCVVGPWLVTADELPAPNDLDFSLHVNGELRQHANTRDLILGIAD